MCQYEHADDLVQFTNKSDKNYNKSLNFSFMHAIFAVLLEVEAFKVKFSKGTPDKPPFDLELKF